MLRCVADRVGAAVAALYPGKIAESGAARFLSKKICPKIICKWFDAAKICQIAAFLPENGIFDKFRGKKQKKQKKIKKI